MDSVSIYSREDLHSLWKIVEERFPNQSVMARRKETSKWILTINAQYLNEFSKIFSRWLHGQIWQEELSNIMSESFELSLAEKKSIFLTISNYIKKKEEELTEIIYQKTIIMLTNYQQMRLEGFTKFSIHEYKEQLEEIVELSFEEYLIEKEYGEFLSLLQYYIEVEEYQFGVLTIVANPDGKYAYYNEKFQNITNHCMQRFITEFEDDSPESDDCLITILILLLPEKITIYGIENIHNAEFLKTLKSIFGNRIDFFQGTDILIEK